MFRVIVAVVLLTSLVGCGGTAPAPGAAAPDRAAAEAVATATPTAPSPSASEPAGPSAIRFEVAHGKLAKGPREVEVALGDQVVLEVASDTADEVHVHGYDIEKRISPGTSAQVRFEATIPGVFEVETHSGVMLCELQVS
jgi:plastocyanin